MKKILKENSTLVPINFNRNWVEALSTSEFIFHFWYASCDQERKEKIPKFTWNICYILSIYYLNCNMYISISWGKARVFLVSSIIPIINVRYHRYYSANNYMTCTCLVIYDGISTNSLYNYTLLCFCNYSFCKSINWL